MIYQNDPRIKKERPYLAKYGCAFVASRTTAKNMRVSPGMLTD